MRARPLWMVLYPYTYWQHLVNPTLFFKGIQEVEIKKWGTRRGVEKDEVGEGGFDQNSS